MLMYIYPCLSIRQKSTKSILKDITQKYFLCHFCRLFLLKMIPFFVNNTLQDLNRTEPNKGGVYPIASKSVNVSF